MDRTFMEDNIKQGYLFDNCADTFHRRSNDFCCLTTDAAGLKRPNDAGTNNLCGKRGYPAGIRDGVRLIIDDAISGVFHGHDAQLLVI